MPWSQPLDHPITLKDGRALITLRDAANLLIRFGEAVQGHAWNKYAAQLLLEAAEIGDEAAIKRATVQIERALFREGML